MAFESGYELAWRDATEGRKRRWPSIRRRHLIVASQFRRGYEAGYEDGGRAGTPLRALEPSAPDAEPHWACDDCGQPCRCTFPGPHRPCGRWAP